MQGAIKSRQAISRVQCPRAAARKRHIPHSLLAVNGHPTELAIHNSEWASSVFVRDFMPVSRRWRR
jgi:hypothetical protein